MLERPYEDAEISHDARVLRRIARRVEDIMADAHARERRGQHLALDINAQFRLQDRGAVQFQVASAILEELGGLRQEEVVTELLSLGLAAVLESAADVAASGSQLAQCSDALLEDLEWRTLPATARAAADPNTRILN